MGVWASMGEPPIGAAVSLDSSVSPASARDSEEPPEDDTSPPPPDEDEPDISLESDGVPVLGAPGVLLGNCVSGSWVPAVASSCTRRASLRAELASL